MKMDELLQKCCFTKKYKGYHALRQCILIAKEDENKLSAYRKLYLEAAPAVNSNPVCMERNMRTIPLYESSFLLAIHCMVLFVYGIFKLNNAA